jgi:xylulose-5-phosphate/fructose-6-phosphate phosphoketolase
LRTHALALLDAWMRSYSPESLFDDMGRLAAELGALAPDGDKRMSATPYANGGRLLSPLNVPPTERFARPVASPAKERYENTEPFGEMLRDINAAMTREVDGGGTFRLFCADETSSNRLAAVFEVTDRCLQAPVLETDDHAWPG